MKSNDSTSFSCSTFLWDAWCTLSLIGIWPRFIETNLLSTTRLTIRLPHLPSPLEGFKILHFSDLHLHPQLSNYFVNKLIKKISSLKPDLIACTGDFLCHALVKDKERLVKILNSVQAPYGCYAVLGNHDYEQAVSINSKGDYDVVHLTSSPFNKVLRRFLIGVELTKQITSQARQVGMNDPLLEILRNSPFELLENTTKVIPVGDAALNVCGLGEYILGRCCPDKAYANYDKKYPGLILLHNPDGSPLLENYPGDMILSGHTHGGQINLPWLWKKLTLMENMQLKKGLVRIGNKWIYVTRGVGGIVPFRWFSLPEIALITLERQ